MNIYVGNLNYRTSEDGLKRLFSQYGDVQSVKLITDKQTGRKKGFGFVEMSDEHARVAINELNEREYDGRNIRVNEAREREVREFRNGGGGNRR